LADLPTGVEGETLQAWRVAVDVLATARTDQAKAVRLLRDLTDLPEARPEAEMFGDLVAKWLRYRLMPQAVALAGLCLDQQTPPLLAPSKTDGELDGKRRDADRRRVAGESSGFVPKVDRPKTVDKKTQAIGLRTKNPNWTAEQIAKEVGCTLANLSQSRRWQAVERAEKPSGRRTTSGKAPTARPRIAEVATVVQTWISTLAVVVASRHPYPCVLARAAATRPAQMPKGDRWCTKASPGARGAGRS
jgi:hypothetical protein